MKKKLVLHSGGMDSTAIMLQYIVEYGKENIISLGFNYGQRHFTMENKAAEAFCSEYEIQRIVLDVPIGQIGGCSLVDHSIPVTTDMKEQRSTVVPMRNGIFMMLAASVAQVNNCDVIVHGACKEDHEAYRDCRPEFFRFLECAIQAGVTSPEKGCESMPSDFLDLSEEESCDWFTVFQFPRRKLDITIDTPLIYEKKEDTMERVLDTSGASVYKFTYSCYNGGEKQCGKCPACMERKKAFEVNNVEDPVGYE